MKKNTKILIICLSVILIVGIVVMISIMNKKSYSDEYSSTDLFNLVSNSYLTEGGTKVLDSDVILEFSDDSIPYLNDFIVVKANNAKNINEIGIFKVEDGKADEMKVLVDKYVEDLQQVYRAMDYFPEEVEKIDFATVKVFGNYVIYSFLNENDTNSFYDAIENNIKQ